MPTVNISLPSLKFSNSDSPDFNKLFKQSYVKSDNEGVKPDFTYNVGAKNDKTFKINLPDGLYERASDALAHYPQAKNVGELIVATVFQVSGIKQAQQKQHKQTNHSAALDAFMSIAGNKRNKEQVMLSERFMQTLQSKDNILLAEASTGVGKGAAMVASAMDVSAAIDTPIVIAAPTFKILYQLISDHRAIDKARQTKTPFSLYYGKREFVSSYKVNQIIKRFVQSSIMLDAKDDALVDEKPAKIDVGITESECKELELWREAGAPDAPDAIVSNTYCVRGLEYYCPSIKDIDAYKLIGTDQKDVGYESYQAQFIGAENSRIIYCTHAMLAQDLINRRFFRKHQPQPDDETTALQDLIGDEVQVERDSKFPTYSHLFIDEAHRFEQSMNAAASKTFPMHHLYVLLKKDKSPHADAYQAIMRLISALNDDSDVIAWLDSDKRLELVVILDALLRKIDMKIKVKSDLKSVVQDGLAVTSRILKIKNRFTVAYVSYSPERRYPSLIVGSTNSSFDLKTLWADKRVILVSATLYLPTDVSENDSRYIKSIINAPAFRVNEMSPIRPKWTCAPVSIHFPFSEASDIDSMLKFTPPKFIKNDENLEAKALWHAVVADYLTESSALAAGGTLVLCTSYATVASLKELLAPMLGERLVHSQLGFNIDTTLNKFKSLALSDLRPVWLAVGQSWEGLSISGRVSGEDYDPRLDNVLTDVVIPKLPFGLNRSISHILRKKGNFLSEYSEVMTLFIQGVGRLVRSDGIQHNRKVHLLDARMLTQTVLKRSINMFLKRYGSKLPNIGATNE